MKKEQLNDALQEIYAIVENGVYPLRVDDEIKKVLQSLIKAGWNPVPKPGEYEAKYGG
jgi:hypothetical protein